MFRLFRVESHVFAKAAKSLKASEGKLLGGARARHVLPSHKSGKLNETYL